MDIRLLSEDLMMGLEEFFHFLHQINKKPRLSRGESDHERRKKAGIGWAIHQIRIRRIIVNKRPTALEFCLQIDSQARGNEQKQLTSARKALVFQAGRWVRAE